nr:reverse transcriptase domain-containing protein [Tanacetum cinerariifolium]
SNTPPDSYSAASHFGGVTDWYQSQGYREPDTIMSDSEDSTVTYTTVSCPYEGRSGDALPPPDYMPGPEEPEQAPPSPIYIPYVLKLVYPEYIPLEDDVFPAEEQPLPATASPTADSPGYIHESDPNEDPEDDDDEDPKEDPEQDEDDDDEEEEHPASADSIPPPPVLRVTARISFRPQPPTLSFTKEDAERFLAMPIPPPSLLTLLSSLLPPTSSPPLPASPLSFPYHYPLHHHPYSYYLLIVEQIDPRPIEGRRADYGFVNSVEAEIRRRRAEDIRYGIRHTWIDLRDVAKEEALTTLEGSTLGLESRLVQVLLRVPIVVLRFILKMPPKKAAPKRTTRLNPGATSNPNQEPSTTTTTVTNAQLQAMIDQGVNAALAARDVNRTGDDSHTSRTGGTEGVGELTQWFERMETVFRISNYLAENQIKFATCTLLAGALTWWNSHVRIVGNDAAYVMTWIELKKKMADKYCPRNEMKKIETEFWNLEVQGTDVTRSRKMPVLPTIRGVMGRVRKLLVMSAGHKDISKDHDYAVELADGRIVGVNTAVIVCVDKIVRITWERETLIFHAGSKDRPRMLAPGNYIQWKSRIKRYIDTKPNRELIHYCLKNPSYELGWKDKFIIDAEGNPTTVTHQDGESLESYYSRFYKIMNEPIRNQCKVTNHQVNVQFLLQLQLERQRFVTLVKQSQELKTVSYHKFYDILKQHQHEVNEIRAEKIAHVANPLALVAQQQPVYHPQTYPTH